MFCVNCGAAVSETAAFCPKCGVRRNVEIKTGSEHSRTGGSFYPPPTGMQAPHPAPVAPGAKGKLNSTAIAIAAIALVCIAAAVILVVRYTGGKGAAQKAENPEYMQTDTYSDAAPGTNEQSLSPPDTAPPPSDTPTVAPNPSQDKGADANSVEPDMPDAPDAADAPDASDALDALDTPDTLDAPDTHDKLDTPDALDTSGVPDAPDKLDALDTPELNEPAPNEIKNKSLADVILTSSDWIRLNIYWKNGGQTVFERDRDSSVWTIRSRDGNYRMVEPSFSYEARTLTLAFPTTTSKYRLYEDNTGDFGGESLEWGFDTDISSSINRKSAVNQTKNLSDALDRYLLLIIRVSWNNGESTVFYKQSDGAWMMKGREGSFASVDPSFSTGTDYVSISFPTTSSRYALYENGTGKYGNESLRWSYSYSDS